VKEVRKICLMAALAAVIAACAPKMPEWQPEDKSSQVFSVATRQLPPPPVYNRIRWVMPPEPLPVSGLPASNAPALRPIMHLELTNATLEETSKILAESARYRSYCSGLIADQRITINKLGTLDELAQAIAEQAGIQVVLDHHSREVRFFAGRTQTSDTKTQAQEERRF
jgi:hypothetical protein